MVSPSSARAYSRFIPKEEIEAGSVTQWSFSAVDGSAPPLPPVEPEPVPEEPLPGVPLEPVAPMVPEPMDRTSPAPPRRVAMTPNGIEPSR